MYVNKLLAGEQVMSDKFTLDVRQAAELAFAFERNGYTNADVKKLSSANMLEMLLPVVRGNAEVKTTRHLINCDADCMPDAWKKSGWEVREEDQIPTRIKGTLEFDPAKLQRWLHPKQEAGVIQGEELYNEIRNLKLKVLPDNVLDFLLENRNLIPDGWKTDEQGRILYHYFFGKIYRYPDGYRYVRYLYWDGGCWRWDCSWLDNDWRVQDPAVLLASEPGTLDPGPLET